MQIQFKNYLLIVFASASLGFSASSFALEPMNLDFLKKQLVTYHDSGAYVHGIQNEVNMAEEYLQKRVAANNESAHPKKLAIVFDIDETTLSNYDDLKALNFGGTPAMIEAAIAKGTDPAITPTLNLYQLAIKDNVAVFFITGRIQKLHDATFKNLQTAGYTSWQKLSLKPNDYNQPSVVPFKSAERAQIVKSGYDIIINIGDQHSDLAGGSADRTFKLPDPYYFIP